MTNIRSRGPDPPPLRNGKPVNGEWKLAAKRILARVGLRAPAEWVWKRRPWGAAYREQQLWLQAADRLDNDRMRLVLASVLDVDSNCIDIGASEGVFLREMFRLSPLGSHIAYEPLKADFDRLVAEFPQALIRNLAVSNTSGSSSYAHVSNAPGWSGLHEYEMPVRDLKVETIKVDTVRLDDDLPPGYVPNLIKIDVNGAERQVFEGALETLRIHRPVVIFEHGTAAAAYDTTPDMIFELLVRRCDLQIFDLQGNGPFDLEEFITAGRTKWNFLARPSTSARGGRPQTT